jgi:hypothetical protein
MTTEWILRLLVGGCVVLAVGCGSKTPSAPSPTPSASPAPTAAPTSTTFQGTIAGANGQTGTLAVTVQAQVAAASGSIFRWPLFRLPFVAVLHAQATTAATGNVHVAGSSTTGLTGTYDSSTKALSLSGSGFTFTGSSSGAAVTGTYSGPNGAAGAFSSRSTAGGSVTVYCGNVFSSGPGQQNVVTGVFNLAVSGASGAISGAYHINRSGYITGQMSGSAFSITYTDRTTGEQGSATGTIQNGTVSGSAPASSGGSNPFSGSTSKCQ